MADQLNPQEEYLFKEYDSAAELTYHIDDLRNKITGFFLVFNGLAIGTLTIVMKGEAKALFNPTKLVAVLFLINGCLGLIVLGILARLRKVQLEHFRIINNIRAYFLQSSKELWKVVELSAETLPMPQKLTPIQNRSSGSYFWALIIIIMNSIILGTSLYLYLFQIRPLSNSIASVFIISFIGLVIVLQDKLYFALAAPPQPR